MCSIWPVIHDAWSESKNAAAEAMSAGAPIAFSGCRAAEASRFSGELRSLSARGVSVSEGAMQFTLIFGANSDASDRVRPYLGVRWLDGGADNDEVLTFATVHYALAGVSLHF